MLPRYGDAMDGSRLVTFGVAISDPSRARILSALVSGRSHTAGELARAAGVAASTTSRHLSVLVDAGVVIVEPAGRFRHYRIGSSDVAHLLELIDSADVCATNSPRLPRPGPSLEFARSCYDHLAGELGVRLYDALVTSAILSETVNGPVLTTTGRRALIEFGIPIPDATHSRRPLTRACVDWTQRTHHLGGALGASILHHLLSAGHLRRGRDPRTLRLGRTGRSFLNDTFGLDVEAGHAPNGR
jgi:DNA-binding transcriptional ArsR family regulator